MSADNPHITSGSEELAAMGAIKAIVLDAGTAVQLEIPGGAMLLVADFSREGPDLLMELARNHHIRKRDLSDATGTEAPLPPDDSA